MADHEIEFSGKFGIPEFKGLAARVEGRYKGVWSTRQADVLDQAALSSGQSVEQLGELLDGADSEALRDVFLTAVVRAREVADDEYRAALGRIVAAATDQAKVDEAVYLISHIIKLQPLELRALWSCATYVRDNGTEESPRCPRELATHYGGGTMRAPRLAERESVSLAAAIASLDVLTGSGFLRVIDEGDPHASVGSVRPHDARWGTTEWGLVAIETTLGLKPMGRFAPDQPNDLLPDDDDDGPGC